MREIVGFWKTKEKYGSFSNWFGAKFEYEGITFKNTEQAFMYLKARLFEDQAMMEAILEAKSPFMCKALGRKVKDFDPAVFDQHKRQFMEDVNYAKFSQNPELKELLLSTGDALICEASPKDHIWAIGMTADDPDFQDPTKWKGQNLLGQALMNVRERLKNEQ